MKAGKVVLIIVIALIIAGGSYALYTKFKNPRTAAETSQSQEIAVKRGTLDMKVTASGNLANTTKVNLTFGSGGTINERLIDMGDSVKKGQILARLDTIDLESSVKSAESAVKSAEKSLKDLKEQYNLSAVSQSEAAAATAQAQLSAAEKAFQDVQSPYNLSPYTPSDIAQAEAAVASAQSQLKSAEKALQDVQPPYNLSPYTPSDIAQAEAAVASAQAQVKDAENALSKAQLPMTNEDIAHYQSAVDNAQKAMDIAQQDLSTAKLNRDRNVTNTLETLRQEQEKYRGVIRIQLVGDTIYDDPRIILGVDTITNNLTIAYHNLIKVKDEAQIAQETGDKNVASAEAAVTKAQDALRKAQEDLSRKTSDVLVDIAVKQQQLASANANLIRTQEDLKKRKAGPEALDIANRQFALENAKANLVKAQEDLKKRKAGPEPLDIANRKAALEAAKANLIKVQEDLKKKKAGPEPEDLATINAQLASAQASLNKARENLAKATVIAPFDGIVASVSGDTGDLVGANTVIASLVNPNKLRLEAMMDETSVIGVKVGQDAQITLDALPNVSMKGKVASVAPISTLQSGVVNYQVFITLDSQAAPTARGNAAGSRSSINAPGKIPAQRTGGSTMQGGPSGQVADSSNAPVTDSTGQPSSQPQLRSGMTAIAEIVTTHFENVLLVPRQAVSGSGRNRTVKVMSNGQVTDRVVQLGVSDEQFIQVMDGLSEGEKVLITPQAARSINPVGNRGGGGFGGNVLPVR